ncbi:MAG: sugar transferase [Flavobacteriaceae bacterium]
MTKRLFDVLLALILFPIIIGPIILLVIVATIDTRIIGIFQQKRIGYRGKSFIILKIRTHNKDEKITRFGEILRVSKLDELPQLFNVFIGSMSFVGPRPDLEGFADILQGDDRIILEVKPGITGPASLKYRSEDKMLKDSSLPIEELKEKIWRDKVRINKMYVLNYSLINDIRYLLHTVIT